MRSRTGALGEFGVGQRVLDDGGFVATVRYVGPVASSKSTDSTVTWIGVEFDDSNRGKHSTGAIEHPITGIQACYYYYYSFYSPSYLSSSFLHSHRAISLSLQQLRFSTSQSNLVVVVHF